MKKLYFLSLLLLIGLAGCYEDKGNYDYDEPYQIDVEGMEDKYVKIALVDSVNVNPQLTPADAEYDCFWGVYLTNVQGYAPKLDTICYTRELHYKVDLEPGTYVLVFAAKERTTGISQIKKASLSVETALTTGWYVLRSQDGYTDLDIFTPDGKIENAIAVNNDGKKLKGEANALAYLTRYKSWDEVNSRYINTVTMFTLASEDGVALKVSNGKIINTFQQLFYDIPVVVNPQDCFGGSTDIFFMNYGQMYTIYNMSSNSGRFGAPKIGNYRLSPYRVYGGVRYPLLYDEESCSFLSADTYANTMLPLSDNGPVDSIKLPPVNNMDADLLFMGPRLGSGSARFAWALMKKKQEDTYLMLKLDANCYTPYKNPIQVYDTLDHSLGIIQADRWTTNLDNDILYYVKGNEIYSCNINADYQERQQAVLPAGENITWMRHMKYAPYNQEDLWFDYLAIATFNGMNYKIYLYGLQGGNLKSDPEMLEGTGKVGAAIYISPITNTPIY